MDLDPRVNRLQTADGIVKSVQEVREIRSDMDDEQFSEWYSDRYKVTLARVKGILVALKEVKA